MRVLIIGSLAGELGQAGRIAMARGAKLEQADDIESGLARLRADARVDVVLCELAHDVGGLVHALATERMAVPVVACGTGDDPEAAVRAMRAGAREFLPLPPDPELIAAILEAAAGESHALVVRDPSMQATLRRVEQVAGSEASVLISGESGTGKEVLARQLHRRSRRAAGPFVAVNCAAIPENLLESELFGHEKGAFSGALARRIGKFEAADGGTLLLDEISEMDVRLQAKLLRAVQEREIDRLGGAAPVRVNVRILATTNRDLLAEVAAGRFREDLYFRLNVVALRLPALRERINDIAALAHYFVDHYASLNGLPPKHLSAEAVGHLMRHSWRGNVRELENTMHRAVLLTPDAEITPHSIELAPPSPGATPQISENTPVAAAPAGGISVTPLVGQRMEAVEQALILETLTHCLGNRTHAATILGISIRALRNKLRDYAAQGAAVPPPVAGIGAAPVAGIGAASVVGIGAAGVVGIGAASVPGCAAPVVAA